MTLRIGISARLLHKPPPGCGLPAKRLQYLESHMAQWVMSRGVVALMIPFVDRRAAGWEATRSIARKRPPTAELVEALVGLVLQGGVDISPHTYGESPWRTAMQVQGGEPLICDTPDYDPIRDEYELELLRGFIEADKPVLGICRGCQLLNVYFGGSLVQDIPTQWPGAIAHNDTERYDRLTHAVRFEPGSRLAAIYGDTPRRITSIHHQCVKQLGRGLVLEATSPADGVPCLLYTSDAADE